MDARLIAKWRWQMQSGLRSLGTAGVVGLGVLAFCLAAYLSAILPAKARLAEMREEASTLRARLTQSRIKEESGPEMQLAAFYRYFPEHAAVPDLLEKLHGAAQASGILLEQGEYRFFPDKEGKLDRYQATLPVRGSYPQIRKFLGRLLAGLPSASLDGVTFQKQKVGDPQVEAQIKLTLYLGEDQ